MKQYLLRFLRLNFGLFLYALGIVLTLNANIGYAPWEVFHVGLSNVLGISIGTASIAVGLIIGVLAALLGEKLGLGTVFNMVMIGVFMDIILAARVLPTANGIAVGTAMLVAGLYVIAAGSYFYISSGFGAGPRDSLMVALTRITKLPVGICRTIIEMAALGTGWLLGGMAGIGTIISVVAIGFCIQTTFKLFRFNPAEVKHETIDATWRAVKAFLTPEEPAAEKETDS